MQGEDFWRFKEHRSGKLSGMAFLEWKYFSFVDDDIRGFICYSIGNPNNVFGLKRGIITYAIYHENGEESGYVEIPGKKIDLNLGKVGHFGSMSIEHDKENFWRLKGSHEKTHWDLAFSGVAPGKHIHLDLGRKLFTDSWMDWLVLCNSAEVKGRVTIGNKVYRIDGMGYCDSNLGHWKPSDTLWYWGNFLGTFRGDIVSLTLGESRFRKKKIGFVYLSVGKNMHVFNTHEYDIIHMDPKEGGDGYTLVGKKEGMDLRATFHAERSDKILLKAFGIVPLIELRFQLGTISLRLKTPDGDVVKTLCRGMWEFPERP